MTPHARGDGTGQGQACQAAVQRGLTMNQGRSDFVKLIPGCRLKILALAACAHYHSVSLTIFHSIDTCSGNAGGIWFPAPESQLHSEATVMTPKRRRWHRHRYFLANEPVTTSLEPDTTSLQAAEMADAAEIQNSDFQPLNQRQGEGQGTLKARAAEAAQV